MDWLKRKLFNKTRLSNKQRVGNRAEKIARQYLTNQGLTFYRANMRFGKDEVDLIFQDGNCWALVEVRYRENTQSGSGLESINGAKLSHLKRSALQFSQHRIYTYNPLSIRVDIVSISGNLDSPNINWVPNAIPFDITN